MTMTCDNAVTASDSARINRISSTTWISPCTARSTHCSSLSTTRGPAGSGERTLPGISTSMVRPAKRSIASGSAGDAQPTDCCKSMQGAAKHVSETDFPALLCDRLPVRARARPKAIDAPTKSRTSSPCSTTRTLDAAAKTRRVPHEDLGPGRRLADRHASGLPSSGKQHDSVFASSSAGATGGTSEADGLELSGVPRTRHFRVQVPY